MNKNILKKLQTIKDELDTYIDLTQGYDDPNHMINQICRECIHPIYYVYGFYKAPMYCKGETELVEAYAFNCDYALLRCLECGDFISVPKPQHICKDWYLKYQHKAIRAIIRKQSYEEIRRNYFQYCLESKKNELQTVISFQKIYPKSSIPHHQ